MERAVGAVYRVRVIFRGVWSHGRDDLEALKRMSGLRVLCTKWEGYVKAVCGTAIHISHGKIE